MHAKAGRREHVWMEMDVLMIEKFVGKVTGPSRGDVEVGCYWLTLRTYNMGLLGGMAIVGTNMHNSWTIDFFTSQGNSYEPQYPKKILQQIETFLKSSNANLHQVPEKLQRLVPKVGLRNHHYFVFAFSEEQAVKAAYEAGLRAVLPGRWQMLAYYEYQQTRQPGDIPGE